MANKTYQIEHSKNSRNYTQSEIDHAMEHGDPYNPGSEQTQKDIEIWGAVKKEAQKVGNKIEADRTRGQKINPTIPSDGTPFQERVKKEATQPSSRAYKNAIDTQDAK